MMEMLAAGRLSQVCPNDCREGWRRALPGPEAAGGYCTACGTPTRPDDWYRGEQGEAQRVALAQHRASRKQETAEARP